MLYHNTSTSITIRRCSFGESGAIDTSAFASLIQIPEVLATGACKFTFAKAGTSCEIFLSLERTIDVHVSEASFSFSSRAFRTFLHR